MHSHLIFLALLCGVIAADSPTSTTSTALAQSTTTPTASCPKAMPIATIQFPGLTTTPMPGSPSSTFIAGPPINNDNSPITYAAAPCMPSFDVIGIGNLVSIASISNSFSALIGGVQTTAAMECNYDTEGDATCSFISSGQTFGKKLTFPSTDVVPLVIATVGTSDTSALSIPTSVTATTSTDTPGAAAKATMGVVGPAVVGAVGVLAGAMM